MLLPDCSPLGAIWRHVGRAKTTLTPVKYLVAYNILADRFVRIVSLLWHGLTCLLFCKFLCFSESSESVKEVPVKSVYGSEKSGIRIVSFLPKVSMMLFLGIWRRGWSWYILGKGKRSANFIIRLIVSFLWFISWGMLFFSITDYRLLFIAFSFFAILRFVDKKEQNERSRFSTEFEM